MAAVFPDQAACPENLSGEVRVPDHPLVKETIGNCLHEAMDLSGLQRLLEGLHEGAVETVAIDTPEPSPFSHEILNANPYAYLDDAPLEERRARAVAMRRTLPEDYAEGAGALDAEAIAQVAAEAWPPMRDADELHEALLGFGVMPADAGGTYRSLTVAAPFREHGESAGSEPRLVARPSESSESPRSEPRPSGSGSFFDELVADRRATSLHTGGRAFWVAAERVDLVRQVYPESVFDPPVAAPAGMRPIPETQERCAAEILRGWFECSGPKRALGFRARAGPPARPSGPGAGAARSGRSDLTRQVHPWRRRFGMVPPAPAGADSPAHHRAAAAGNRAGFDGRVLRISQPLAAPGAGHAIARHGWNAGHHPAVARMRVRSGGVGNGDPAAARGALPARVPGRALPGRRSELGTDFASPCVRAPLAGCHAACGGAARFEDSSTVRPCYRRAGSGRAAQPARAPHARGAAGDFSARRRALAPGHAAAIAAGFALASGARNPGGPGNPRRLLFRRSDARHRPPGQRSGRRVVGTGGGRAGYRRRFRESARAARPQAAPRRGQGPHRASAPRARTLGAAAAQRKRAGRTAPKPSRGNCWRGGEWCSAMPPRASRWRPHGASCWCPCAAWNRAAKCAADVFWKPSSASSSRCRKRSTCCAPSAGPAKPRRKRTGSERRDRRARRQRRRLRWVSFR